MTASPGAQRRSRPHLAASLAGFLSAGLLLGGLAVPAPAMAWVPCDDLPYANKFLGMGKTAAGMKGVYSEIEFHNEQLCVQDANIEHSWSLSWVSLDGTNSSAPGIDIYQGGIAKCPPPAVGSCPWNGGVPYYWYFYGREQTSTCGVAFNTGIVKVKGNASGVNHEFQISKVGTMYNYYIDHVVWDDRSLFEIETCWGSVTAAEWQNEMLDNNDQGGGAISNKLTFGDRKYQTAAGWLNDNRALNSLCDANSYPAHWHCRTSSAIGNYFNAWDDRDP